MVMRLNRHPLNRLCSKQRRPTSFNFLIRAVLVKLFFFFSIGAACYAVHYIKRLLETIFVHRFSHATMPFFNLFKNCSYYWLFTAYVAYHVNHPKFTAPSVAFMYGGLALFVVSFMFPINFIYEFSKLILIVNIVS